MQIYYEIPPKELCKLTSDHGVPKPKTQQAIQALKSKTNRPTNNAVLLLEGFS